MNPCIHNAHLLLQKNSIGGLPIDAMAYIIAKGFEEGKIDSSTWIVLPDEAKAEIFVDLLKFWYEQPNIAFHFPADEIDCFQGLSPSRHLPQQRLIALQKHYSEQPSIVVSSVFAAMHKTQSPSCLKTITLYLQCSETYSPSDITLHLQNAGYTINQQMEEPGQYRHIGDTIHIWPIGEEFPIRLSFFDIELEAIHQFSEKGKIELKSVTILPAREMVLQKPALQKLSQRLIEFIRKHGYGRERRRYLLSNFEHGIVQPGAEDYLPYLYDLQINTASFIILNPEDCISELERWSSLTKDRWSAREENHHPLIETTQRYAQPDQIINKWNRSVHLFEEKKGSTNCELKSVTALRTHQHLLEPLLRQLRRWVHLEYTVIFISSSHNRAKRLEIMLQERDTRIEWINSPKNAKSGEISLCVGQAMEGFIDDDIRLAVLSIEFILHIPKPSIRSIPKSLKDAIISNASELKPNDLVVHRDHGIGKFRGITAKTRQKIVYDCLEIEYANNAVFYLPVEKIEQLYRYRSMGGMQPKLDRIGSPSWQKRLGKAKEKALILADKLIAQFALRALNNGYQYQGFPKALNEFSLSFPYQETPDQQIAIEEVLQDLASDQPTNRLIIGDVGFGKTEVAMRATMRVVAENHQVALLCPTTILALQHHRTFLARFTPFGVRVAVLSRLQTASQKKKIFRLVQAGEIDVLIGTHAMFGKDLRFKRLGLVVADEEHRFGVAQKEKLLSLSQVNPETPTEYLAMSATPIPRTLHLALSGLRNVSVISTPPPGRRAIKTLCLRFDIERIAKQIQIELQRGGQVFFIHNRINDLEHYAQQLRNYFPKAIIRTASGRSKRSDLEKTMLEFMEQRINILVCTTIVENGVDLPNVNTIFINNAHQMGLSQLYQLRGRVGRGKEQGHCILLIPPETLNQEALARVNALKQFTSLGSGFAIANADLEIRGSGDLLGKEQSGNINSIGLDTYIDILNDAILELKPKGIHRFIPEINIPISTVIPTDYIADIELRLQAYRQLATASSFIDIQRVLDEWEKNFGEIPQPAMQTVRLAELRIWARILGIERIDWLKTRVRCIAHPSTPISWKALMQLAKKNPKRFELVSFSQGLWQMYIYFSPEEAKNPLNLFQWVFPLMEEQAETSPDGG